MTKEEWSLLVKAIKSAYPNQTFCPDSYSLELYYRMLQDIPYEVLNIVIQRHIATNRYPPTIADLRGSVSPKEKEWSEGWEEVKRAIRNYGSYREKEALDSMSPLTREIVQRFGFKEICMSENEDVYRANFRMAYEQSAKKNNEVNVLPETVKARLNGILQIGEGI